MKSNVIRALFLILILTAGVSLMTFLYTAKPKTPFRATLTPAYQLFGRTPASLNRALSKVVPVNDLDEKQFGEALARKFECMAQCSTDSNDKDILYLNRIMKKLQKFARKPFNYRVFVDSSSTPNACAMPGGVILVTKGLFLTLKSESEFVSVLGHEMGHVELSHCMDIVRFELLSEKIGADSMGALADFAVNILIGHSYSKTHEEEADDYGYEVLLNTEYNPGAAEKAFQRLQENSTKPRGRAKAPRDPISEYFMTHPYLELRAEKYGERARVWWGSHGRQKRYEGVQNLTARQDYSTIQFKDEWVVASGRRGAQH